MKQTETPASRVYFGAAVPPPLGQRETPNSANMSAAARKDANDVFRFSRCEWVPGYPLFPVVMVILAKSGKEELARHLGNPPHPTPTLTHRGCVAPSSRTILTPTRHIIQRSHPSWSPVTLLY